MKITIDLANLKTAINNVSKFVGETHLLLEKDELVIKEFSADRAAHYETRIRNIEIDGEGEFVVFVNALQLIKILKSFGKDAKISLEYIKDKLTVVSIDNKKKFELPIYVETRIDNPVPDINYEFTGKIPSNTLANVLASAEATNKNISSIHFKLVEGLLKVDSWYDNYTYKEDIKEYENDAKKDYLVKLGISWLNSISDCLISDIVTFNFGSDMPLTVIDESEGMTQTFILAPRIDNE